MKDKQKRKKERTWAEAARMVLENFSDAPMTPKQILHVIQTKGLKEMRSGTAPLACLVTMLHSQVRGDRVKNSIFFKLPGRMSLFTLKKNALQWTKSPTANESGDGTGTPTASTTSTVEGAEQESCDSTETAAASGENDASVDETSSSASCSTEPQTRLSRSSQSGRQRKKAVMMPRVVLTPLKVNGEHVPSGAAGRRREGSRGGPGPTLRTRSELGWKRTQHFKSVRGLRSGPMKRNRGGVEVDFETPGSILVNTNIRALINTRTFAAFPPHSQQQLLQLLPEVDRQVGPDGLARLSSSALNNEFFTHASQSWKERLAEGEFTHEMQVRFRQEMEKEKKVEAWKEKFFEEYHGQRSGLTREEALKLTMSDAGDVAGAVLNSDSATVATPKRRSVGRRRREGRIRRRSRADLRRRARRTLCKTTTAAVPSAETTESTATPDVEPSVASPVPEATAVQGEVVLQTDFGLEAPEENLSAEAVPSPAPVPTPPPTSTSSTCDEPEVSTDLLPEVPEPAVVSTSSPSSSSSSTSSSSSSPSSSPSSASERQTFAASSDSSSSSSSSTAAVATDPLDDGASVITTGTAGTGASSRESSPAASPATASPAIQLKEQKRRPDESQAFTSFPEKRARMDERQSFRNTVDCVHSEKPQPTTEEPKVPPIRIQLSRIKPPWVKGPPTYQICPRIVPPSEGSRRSGTGARTLADIKARAQQARAQREAAAAVAASGDGGGPGGSGPGGGLGIPDRSSGRRSREHPGPVEPGGGGGRRGRVDLEEQESPASSHSSGPQLQLSSVDSADRPQTSTPLTEPSPSSVSSNPSLPPSESPKTLTLSPTATDSSASQDQVEEICGVEEVTACPSDEASEQTLDTPVPTPSEPESFCSHQEMRGEEAESNESRTNTPVCTSASNDAVSLVPTSIPDSVPRFGAQGVDVIRTLAASSQPWEGDKNGVEHHPGTTGVIQHGSDLKIPKDTLITVRNGWVESSEEHSMREGMLQVHKNGGDEDDDGKYESASLPGLQSNGGEEDTGAHSDSTETASDFENEAQDDETVDWHGTQMNSNGMQAQITKSQNQPVIQNSSRLTSSVVNTPQHQQPVIQAHISNPNHTQTVIQARFPNGVSNQPVIHSHKQHPINPQAINHAQDQITTAPSQAQMQAYLTQTERDQSRNLRLNDNSNGVKLFVSTEDDTKPLSRGPGEDFVLKNSAVPPIGRRVQGSSRPVSSVEANNPLVTQLLQGSLPLEKVLQQPHLVSKLEINRLPGAPAGNSASRQPPRNLGPSFRGPSDAGGSIETGGSDFQHKAPSIRVSPGPGRNFGTSPPGSIPSRTACLFEEASPRSANVQFTSQQPGGAMLSGAVPVITSLPSNSSARTSIDVNSQNAPVYESAVIKEHPGPLPPRGETPERPAGFQQHPNHLSQSVCRTAPDAPSPPHGDLCPSEVVPTIKINWRPSKPQPHQIYQQPLSPVGTVKNEVLPRPSCQQALTKNSPAPNGGNTSVVITKKEPLDNFHGGGGAMEGLINMEMSLVRMAKKEQVKNPYARQVETSASPISSSPSSSASSLPYQLYGKLPKLQQSGGNGGSSSSFSYTANVSVVDSSGFSRSLADGVLQLRPRVSVGNSGGPGATLSIQAFADSAAEEVALKCSCRLKAMIMCQGCGAFCHDDCIGPSKLCVSCLVVR
ncbi:polycomb group protein ASXL1-like isoform X3 [Carassius carassius]|uniref:polycomb group protein ASXL1-like isoform X3 n=1 Tax=Carassius carassius TaxID=217509 RepID=UPI0028687CCA|nr:polycomb group protein ASXL1-like isoform X3 [Carassius carassius]